MRRDIKTDWRPGAYAVVTDGDRVLLSLWLGKRMSRWTLPGGGIEFEESPAEAAVREVKEESGYDVELETLIDTETAIIPARARHIKTEVPLTVLRIIYTATITGGELRPETDGSSVDAAWLPIDKLDQLEHTGGHIVGDWVLRALHTAGFTQAPLPGDDPN